MKKFSHNQWFRLMVLAVLMLCAAAQARLESEQGFEGAVRIDSQETGNGYVIVKAVVPYLDVFGKPKEGLARLVVKEMFLKHGSFVPAFCHVHYEKGVDDAKRWAGNGWAVFSAVYTGEKEGYPIDAAIGNGYNQARAIVQWARRLPFIDASRLHIDGGSQGGYASLAVSADMFPVTSTTADVPVVNWAYNLAYFEANRKQTKYPVKAMEDSPLPIMASVTMLADWCYKYFGADLSAEAYYRVSPLACVDRIANPVAVSCFTGDMLVPIEQMTRTQVRPFDAARFPEGYTRDFDKLTVCPQARKTFEECIPEKDREIFVVPRQENSFELNLAMFKDAKTKPSTKPKSEERPWSKKKQWSLVYCDEGGPVPQGAHSSWEWNLSATSFIQYHKDLKQDPRILNASKLEWLMQRLDRATDGLPQLVDGHPVNRFNFEGVEKRDVVSGLLAYAKLGKDFEMHATKLYKQSSRKPLGEELSIPGLEAALK